MGRLKRTLLLIGLLSLLVAIGQPVRADDRGSLEIAAGRTLSKEFPAIAVPMPLSDVSWDPNNCITAPWCDRLTLKVRVPAHPEDHRLTIKLEWLGGPQLTASNQCYLYLWNDPQPLYPVRESACVGDVASIDFVPIKPTYQLVVRNFTATKSTGYRLKLIYE